MENALDENLGECNDYGSFSDGSEELYVPGIEKPDSNDDYSVSEEPDNSIKEGPVSKNVNYVHFEKQDSME